MHYVLYGSKLNPRIHTNKSGTGVKETKVPCENGSSSLCVFTTDCV